MLGNGPSQHRYDGLVLLILWLERVSVRYKSYISCWIGKIIQLSNIFFIQFLFKTRERERGRESIKQHSSEIDHSEQCTQSKSRSNDGYSI